MNASITELIFAGFIVLVVLSLAAYYTWRPLHTLRNLQHQENLSREERVYLLAQAWRRLIGSGLMVMMVGLFLITYSLDTKSLAYSACWIMFLLVLLAIVCLAFFDFWATRRFGLRNYRQIQADRREMLQQQVARFRSERNGH